MISPDTNNFAIIGVAGFVAPRHLRAIEETGNRLVAATDPHDSVGVLDRFSLDVRFFPEIERFDRFLEKRRRGPAADRVHYVSICSPNYLHDAHVRLALRVGAHAICEKPLVINPWNLDALAELEAEAGCRVYTILQLRQHPGLLDLRGRIERETGSHKHEVVLSYITGRGKWYQVSWKGSPEKSGGLVTNIGIHLFDLLIWLFGRPERWEVHVNDDRRIAGFLELERAKVRWFLSVDSADAPGAGSGDQQSTYRFLSVDGQEVEFSAGFNDLHTRVYQEVLAGRGCGIEEARPSVELTHGIRQAGIVPAGDRSHPLLHRG